MYLKIRENLCNWVTSSGSFGSVVRINQIVRDGVLREIFKCMENEICRGLERILFSRIKGRVIWMVFSVELKDNVLDFI